jgi:hypothetical protein
MRHSLIVLGILGFVGCGGGQRGSSRDVPAPSTAVAASAVDGTPTNFGALAPGDINFAFSEIPQGAPHAHVPGYESLYWGNTESISIQWFPPAGPIAQLTVKGVHGDPTPQPWCFSQGYTETVSFTGDVSALGAKFPDWFGLTGSGLPALKDRHDGARIFTVQGGNKNTANCTWLPYTPVTGQVGQYVAPDEMLVIQNLPGDSSTYLYIAQHDPAAGNRPIYSYYWFE